MNKQFKVTQDDDPEKTSIIVPESMCSVSETNGDDVSRPVLPDKAKSQLAVWKACLAAE